MIIAIIILAYITNIFLNRWLAYKLWKLNNFNSSICIFWFIPIATTIASLIVLSSELNWKQTWFTGKYWKK